MGIDGDFTCLPTLGGIGKAIAGTKPRSAPGPDGVGPGIYRSQKASTWSSVQLHALVVKQTCTLRSPLQSRGGGLFSLWKRSATALECKNHRAILLGNSDSKVVAKAERNVIPTAAFDTISHEFLTQCGGLKGRGTDIANLAVRCVFATRKIRSRSGISTYVDIFTAFYAVIRQLVVPCAESDDAIARLFLDLKLDTDTIHSLARVLAEPTVLEEAGLPKIFEQAISLHFEATWFQIDGADSFATAACGTRPGHPFADLIFNFVLGKIVFEAGTKLKVAGLIPDYPYSGELTPVASEQVSQVDVPSAIIGFVDDAFINTEVPNDMIIAQGFECLFSKAIDTIAIVASTFADHALFVNDKVGKSEAMAHVTISTKAARVHIAQRGPLVIHYGRAKPLTIHFVGKYKHLGGQVVANSDMYEEVCYRSGTARSIEKAVGRIIYGNPDLDSTKRMFFFSAACRSPGYSLIVERGRICQESLLANLRRLCTVSYV